MLFFCLNPKILQFGFKFKSANRKIIVEYELPKDGISPTGKRNERNIWVSLNSKTNYKYFKNILLLQQLANLLTKSLKFLLLKFTGQ